MAMLSRIAMIGMIMIEDPSVEIISVKDTAAVGTPESVAFGGMEKGGGWKPGSPPWIVPVSRKVQL